MELYEATVKVVSRNSKCVEPGTRAVDMSVLQLDARTA